MSVELRVTPLLDVHPERVQWLWPGRIPLGKISVVDGDPGLGKTTLMLDLAARITSGRVLPDGSRADLDGPAAVVIMTAEDGLADTIRPRLDAAGADVGRCYAFESVTDEGDDLPRPVELPKDTPHLEQVLAETGAALVVIDPLMAFLAGDVNSHRDQDVRRVLAGLAAVAERTGAAIVIIRHLNKASGTSAIYRGGGSIGIIGAARSGLLVANDPDDESGERRVLAVSKGNLAARPPALAYRLEPYSDTSRIVWLGATDHRADQLLASHGDDEQRSAVSEAVAFLESALAAGPQPADEVTRQARSLGISERTLKRARHQLGVTAARIGGIGPLGRWELALPKGANDVTAKRANVSITESLAPLAAFGPLSSADDGKAHVQAKTEEGHQTGFGPLSGAKSANAAKGAKVLSTRNLAPLAGACWRCGSVSWWRRSDGERICSTCHPNPAATAGDLDCCRSCGAPLADSDDWTCRACVAARAAQAAGGDG